VTKIAIHGDFCHRSFGFAKTPPVRLWAASISYSGIHAAKILNVKEFL
jgi:hypothetical protein